MSLLKIRNEHGEIVEIPALKGNKGDKGDSGVYVGSGNIPDGYNVQIDPAGEIPDLATKEYVDIKIGDIDTALDNIIAQQESIIAIQNALIGGESV